MIDLVISCGFFLFNVLFALGAASMCCEGWRPATTCRTLLLLWWRQSLEDKQQELPLSVAASVCTSTCTLHLATHRDCLLAPPCPLPAKHSAVHALHSVVQLPLSWRGQWSSLEPTPCLPHRTSAAHPHS